jgi:hypothetical protein
MSHRRVHHPQLVFPEEVRTDRLAEPQQEQCQQLLSQMLQEVIAAECQEEEDDHE